MIFLSFGGGVQSSVLLMMAIRGDIERPDHVIWADTGFEKDGTYSNVKWFAEQCRKAGIPFHRVKAGKDLREGFHSFEDGMSDYWHSRPPLFTNGGQLKRQCTREVKIKPIRKKQLELMGYKTARGVPACSAVVQIGISTDEARRAAPSGIPWEDREYPLIAPLKMSRADCQSWWNMNYPERKLVSSSCTICPYHSATHIQGMDECDIAEAIAYDQRIRDAYKERTNQDVYLHRKEIPLSNLIEESAKQLHFDLDDQLFCAGGCGL